jgi:ubiquinone/menaquinone biosynthesis C-methylase UbiE
MTARSRVLIAAVLLAALLALVLFLATRVSRGTEVDRLAQVLGLRDGMVVAEIGAGTGWLTVEVARKVAPSGRVYSTELDPGRLAAIREALEDAGLTNVTVVEAGERATNLPASCCDAIFMRRVYHHFGDARAMVASISDALKPAGQLVIIEFRASTLPGRILGEGIDPEPLVEQVTAGGFDVVRREDWPGWGHYVAQFRKR